MLAAVCDRIDAMTRAVKGGTAKFHQMLRAPHEEVVNRVFELLVAARAAEKGRLVEFVDNGAEPTPDLRINDFDFPLALECKFLNRWSTTDRKEGEVIQTVFRAICENYRGKISAVVELTIAKRICDVRADKVCGDIAQQLDRLIPFGTCESAWGSLTVRALDPEIEWAIPTRIYGPLFLKEVFQWEPDTGEWDGICAWIVNSDALIAQRVKLPLGLKWRLSNQADEWAKSRDVMRSLQEAAQQIPVGEAGGLHVGFEDIHRNGLADMRTKRIIERLPKFWHRKRGVNIQYIVANRIYARAMPDGRPDLIESSIPASIEEEGIWVDLLPTNVFVDPDE